MIRIGLRFAHGDAPALHKLADRVRSGEILGDVGTYHEAAISAETGEPLIVYCDHPDQALLMAAAYATVGISRPAVEELTGLRPPN